MKILETCLCLCVVAGLLAIPMVAGSQGVKATADRTKKTLERTGPQPVMQPDSPGLAPLPANEVVRLRCPRKLIHYSTELDRSAPDMSGWIVQPLVPGNVRTEIRFQEVVGLDHYSWKSASSIECKYGTEIQDRHYRTTLTRKVHPSGTPYRCRVKADFSPEVECRLSITPDFGQ